MGFLVILALMVSAIQSEIQPFYTLDKDRNLNRPKPDLYRKWEVVGAGAVPNDLNRNRAIFPGVHLVYIDPVAFNHRRESGFFPDGTVIIMENYHQKRREGVSGIGYFESGERDLLVSVKDRRVFPGSGWSYYLFSDKEIREGVLAKPPSPKSDCQACHLTHASDDEVFVDFYPQLKRKADANTKKVNASE